MKVSTGIAVVTASLLLSACTTTQSDKITAANGSSIGLHSGFASADMNNNRAPDTVLREVTPSYTAAGVGLNVLTSVLSGGIAVNSFSKENLKGSKIDTLPEPTSAYLTPKAKPLIASWLEKNGSGRQYKNNLNIVAAQWLLVYKDLSSENSDYELRYTVKFYKKPEDANMFSAWVISECTPPVVTASLTDWRANNYALVTKTTEKYMDACLLELDNQLPRLLSH